MADAKQNSSRMIQLDFLRGIAILMVIAEHAGWNTGNGVLSLPAKLIVRIGWTGVDLFFVLSGFLIGGLLFKEIKSQGQLDVKRFLIRRGFKIWPAYFTYLIAILAFTLITPSNLSLASKLQTVAPNLLHIQNYVLPSSSLLLHTWSLAVEEHFYLLLPCFLWFICRKSGSSNRLPQIPIAAGILIALCTALRCYQAFVVERALSPDRHVLMILTHWRMDSLFFGVLIAYLKEFHPQRLSKLTGSSFKRTSLLVAGLALVSPMFFLDSHLAVVKSFGLTSLYFGYGAILLSVVSSPVGVGWQGRFLGSKVTQILASIGVSSYSIYLWHLALGREPMFFLSHTGFLNSLPTSVGWWAFTLLYGSLAVFAGMAMGRLIETPSLLLREKLFPAKSALKQESKAEMSKPTYGSKAA